MLPMLRTRPSCFVGMLVALLLSLGSAAIAAQPPAAAAQPEPVRHAGGEANLVLPDLGQVDFQGINGRTLLMVGLGVRLFDQVRTGPIELEQTRVIESDGVTHIDYRVVK